jgi:hypothetical protein
MTLEERVTQGRLLYAEAINFDVEHNRLEIWFVPTPPKSALKRILSFSQIHDYEENWFDEPDEDCLYCLIGISERPHDLGVKYFVCLDSVEISFLSTVEPEVRDQRSVFSFEFAPVQEGGDGATVAKLG